MTTVASEMTRQRQLTIDMQPPRPRTCPRSPRDTSPDGPTRAEKHIAQASDGTDTTSLYAE